MREKQFVLDYEDDDTIFIDDNKLKKHLTIRNVKIKMGDLNDIVDRLNQLSEENEQLEKGKMEALSLLGEEIDKNEELRQEIVHLKDDLQYFKTKSARLEEELLSTRGCMYE